MVQQKSDFPSVEVFVLCCSVDGAPPQGRMQIFSDLHTREDPVLVTTPLNHTYRLHFLISDSYSIFDTPPSSTAVRQQLANAPA